MKRGDINFISINWEKGITSWIDVDATKMRIEQVGGYILDFIEKMSEQKLINLSNVEMIGHCVGAHIAGWGMK